jgi:hypothetical protein
MTRIAIDIKARECFLEKDHLLILGGAGLGFISATIFNRKLGLRGAVEAEKYVGSSFANLYIVLYVITQPGDCYYLRGPVVTCHPATSDEIRSVVIRDGGRIENEAFQVFGVNFSVIVREFSASFDSQIIKKTLRKSFGQTWRGVLVGSVGGWDTTKGKRFKLIRNFWMFPESWLAFILFLLPKGILKQLYKIYTLNRKRKIS